MSLPPLSESEIEAIRAHGFTNNKTYQNKLPRCFIPKTFQYNLLTFGLMAASFAGIVYGKKYKLVKAPFVLVFVSVPIVNLLQRRQLDTVYDSSQSKLSLAERLQEFPEQKQSFQTVSKEADQQIQRLKSQIQILKRNRKNN